jgi:hypothetical protein
MRLEQPAKEQFTEEQHEYYERATAFSPAAADADGRLLGPAAVGIQAADLGLGALAASRHLEAHKILPKRVGEIVILTVAVTLEDEFIWHAHSTYAHYKEASGMTDDLIACIRQRRPLNTDDPIELAAYDVARALTERGDLTDEEFAAATAVLTIRQLIEITFLVGGYWTRSLQMRVFRVGAPPGVPVEFAETVSAVD